MIFGFLRYDLCLPITDSSVTTAISLLFLCYFSVISVMDSLLWIGHDCTMYYFYIYKKNKVNDVKYYLGNYYKDIHISLFIV